MALVTAAIIGGGALSAGSNIGGALLSKSPKISEPRVAATGLDVSPGLQIAEFYNMLELGIYDPTPLLRASPISLMISELQANPAFRDRPEATLIANLQAAIAWDQAGRPEGTRGAKGEVWQGIPKQSMSFMLNQIQALTGYNSVDELLAAENAYKAQLQPLLQSAQSAAAGNFRAQLDVRNQIVNLIGNLPDASRQGIEQLRGEEKARLLRDLNRNIDEQRGDLLELANAGNFNPGRPLGDIEEFRARATQDADLEALGRALALIGGQQSVAGANLSMLYGDQQQTFNRAAALAQADQGFGGSQIGSPIIKEPNNALANAVAASGQSLGNAASGAAGAYQQGQFNQQYLDLIKAGAFAPGYSPG